MRAAAAQRRPGPRPDAHRAHGGRRPHPRPRRRRRRLPRQAVRLRRAARAAARADPQGPHRAPAGDGARRSSPRSRRAQRHVRRARGRAFGAGVRRPGVPGPARRRTGVEDAAAPARLERGRRVTQRRGRLRRLPAQEARGRGRAAADPHGPRRRVHAGGRVRLPIRARLTAWYAALLAAIVVALGAFLVLQLGSDLQAAVDRHVRDSAIHIARAYAAEGPGDFRDASRTALAADGIAQVLDPTGRVLHVSGPLARRRALAGAGDRAQALRAGLHVVTVQLGPNQQEYRAAVMPVRRLGQVRVLVVGETLNEAQESVERVLLLLLLAGPAALAATALGGWWLARKALRPVERMTSEAGQIGIDRLSDRIAVPRVADEVGRLAVTLNAMLDRLEQGVREKHRLIADASHELRTPLAVMRAEIDVSLRGDYLPPAACAVLESAREEVDRMSRTVDNLLTLAQVDEGRLELLVTPVSLIDAIDAAARPLRPLAAAKDVELTVDGESFEVQA